MQSTTRVILCRLAFLLLILLPTAVVGAWAVQRSQPVYRNGRQEEWTRFLAQQFGVKVDLAAVSYPTYWVARLDGLRLAESESGATLLACRTLEATRTRDGWVIEASQPDLHIDQLPALAAVIESRILRGAAAEALPCEVQIGELTLRAGEAAQTITNVRIVWTPTAEACELAVEFRAAGIESPQPCRLLLKRDRTATPPTTRWEFSTGNVALPCGILAPWLPVLEALGKDAKFVGRVTGETSSAGGSGEIDGRFFQLDLNSLVSAHSAHRLTGFGDVLVSPLKYEAGRITEIRGTVDGRGGYVSETLLKAAREHLRLGADQTPPPPAQDGLIPYRRLACGFRLDASGLVVEGNADPTRQGVVLAAAAGPLALDPTEKPLPATAVLRTLVPQAGLQVPAARETLPLLDILPAPSVQPTPDMPPRVRVRLRP